MIEKLIAAAWNRLAASNKSTAEQGSGLDLGFQVIDGEVLRRRAHLPQSKRAEHVAILGKTGQGKSFFLRHLAGQDIQRGQGFVFFDLHGDTMPFLLRLIAAQERKRGADLSEKLIVIEPGDPEFSVGLNVLEAQPGQQSYVQLAEFAQILKARWHLDSFGARTEELLRNALHVLADNGCTLLEISPLLTHAAFRAACLNRVQSGEVSNYFRTRFDTRSEAMQGVYRDATVVDLYQAACGEAHENFVRKDLLPSEIVALKRAIEPLERRAARERQGSRTDLCLPATVAECQGAARDKIARYLGVGKTTIDRAEAVVEAAEEDPEEYGHLVEQMDRSGKVAGAYRRLEVLKQARELDAAAPELPTGPFQVIVADPPWQYETGNSLPYPTMPLEDIKAMPVREIADENAILWLWTTNAHLRVAFDVVVAWGFEYKTLLTWMKDRMGTGEWLRGQTEHCLLGTRGKPVFIHGNHTTVLKEIGRAHV
jgi:N6-adenosine-specific RNA methylase IME4